MMGLLNGEIEFLPVGSASKAGDAIVIRVVLKTAPGKQGEIARELRERVKNAFDDAGVAVATPATT